MDQFHFILLGIIAVLSTIIPFMAASTAASRAHSTRYLGIIEDLKNRVEDLTRRLDNSREAIFSHQKARVEDLKRCIANLEKLERAAKKEAIKMPPKIFLPPDPPEDTGLQA